MTATERLEKWLREHNSRVTLMHWPGEKKCFDCMVDEAHCGLVIRLATSLDAAIHSALDAAGAER